MKIMEQDRFNRLIHDLGYISEQVLKELRTYDNIRIDPLNIVQNKQPYSIILNGDKEIDNMEAKISYNYIDTDNIQQYSQMIIQHCKDNIKQQLNKLYGTNEERQIKHLYKNQDDNIKRAEELKLLMFKLEVVKLMQQYNLSISHEDLQGAFRITNYNQEEVEWFLEAEYKDYL
jgi:hypothetical protein